MYNGIMEKCSSFSELFMNMPIVSVFCVLSTVIIVAIIIGLLKYLKQRKNFIKNGTHVIAHFKEYREGRVDYGYTTIDVCNEIYTAKVNGAEVEFDLGDAEEKLEPDDVKPVTLLVIPDSPTKFIKTTSKHTLEKSLLVVKIAITGMILAIGVLIYSLFVANCS